MIGRTPLFLLKVKRHRLPHEGFGDTEYLGQLPGLGHTIRHYPVQLILRDQGADGPPGGTGFFFFP